MKQKREKGRKYMDKERENHRKSERNREDGERERDKETKRELMITLILVEFFKNYL